MSEQKLSILEDWLGLKEDMTAFLPNPYKWLESELEKAILPPESEGSEMLGRFERRNLRNLLDILKTVNATYSPSLKI
jgi:hypothetical protein